MTETALYFSSLLDELQKGNDVMTVTVIDCIGSAPRGVGARMLVGGGGRVFGTVGGGAVEYRAEKEAAAFLKKKISAVRHYDLSGKDLGMVCGGAVTAAFHYIKADQEDVKALCRTALSKLLSPCCLWLWMELPGGDEADAGTRSYPLGLYQPDGQKPDGQKPDGSPAGKQGAAAVPLSVRNRCKGGRGGYLFDGAKTYYLEQIAENCLVHLFGGGHVTRELAPLLTKTGFFYAVYDDREEYVRPEDFPDCAGTAAVSFNCLEGRLFPAAEHYYVIMTRGHLYDLQVQSFVMGLYKPAAYIGVMGSKRKTTMLREKLEELGFTKEELDQIHSPIGLPVGAETPAEIAVSITAQLIQVRSCRRKQKECEYEAD